MTWGASCIVGRPLDCTNRPLAWRQCVSQQLAVALFAVRARGAASEENSVSSHAEKVVSKASQDTKSKHKKDNKGLSVWDLGHSEIVQGRYI